MSEVIKSLKGVIAALAVIILGQNFSVRLLQYTLLCSVFFLRESQRREENRSINKDGRLFAVIVNLFPQKGIFTLRLP
jgi:hypothetical protein